ncbi:hypothetical protein THAR02_04261 [Trichoderma harzianum]|uniref:Uncharacterized protein n=1 Tax=Trichoderma harzianum TaxID=5544 RepID=A0A0F9XF31_TRIHA|nr:hypothetical protein THAR02_04261 [Trichoderma harzianum]
MSKSSPSPVFAGIVALFAQPLEIQAPIIPERNMLAANVIRHCANPSFGRAPPHYLSPGMFWSLPSSPRALQVAVPRCPPPHRSLGACVSPKPAVAASHQQRSARRQWLQQLQLSPRHTSACSPMYRYRATFPLSRHLHEPLALELQEYDSATRRQRQSATPQPNAVSPPSSPYLDPHLFLLSPASRSSARSSARNRLPHVSIPSGHLAASSPSPLDRPLSSPPPCSAKRIAAKARRSRQVLENAVLLHPPILSSSRPDCAARPEIVDSRFLRGPRSDHLLRCLVALAFALHSRFCRPSLALLREPHRSLRPPSRQGNPGPRRDALPIES